MGPQLPRQTSQTAAGSPAAGRPAARGGATVLVAVQAPQVREALSAIVGALDACATVAEAATDEEALALARSLRPTLAIVDQDLPRWGGAWLIQALWGERLVGTIVAMGLRADDATRARASAAGARAFVQTGAPPYELLQAIDEALRPQWPGAGAQWSASGTD